MRAAVVCGAAVALLVPFLVLFTLAGAVEGAARVDRFLDPTR
jgi:hypothetical protein